ncbi:MAG: hypothetical protein NC833_03100 [Candidatus Omnitrophica bacterium]|nr:hypothetical protein [Candidatus Omnitrophota bacterium]
MDKKIIILEGIDKVGKSTIKEKIHKMTNYKYIIVDRFIGSNYVYSKFKNRENDDELKKYLELEKKIQSIDNFYFIYLYTDKKDIIKRIKQTKEIDIKIKDIDKLINIYEEYLLQTSLDYYRINTSLWTPQKCAEIILKHIERNEIY